MVKNPLAMPKTQGTLAHPLGFLEEETATITVFLPGKSHGQRSLAGYTPWGQSDMTEQLSMLLIKMLIPSKTDS